MDGQAAQAGVVTAERQNAEQAEAEDFRGSSIRPRAGARRPNKRRKRVDSPSQPHRLPSRKEPSHCTKFPSKSGFQLLSADKKEIVVNSVYLRLCFNMQKLSPTQTDFIVIT